MVTKVSSLVIIQSGKGGIQKADKFYDDVTLGVINKTNNVAPNLTNKYLSNNVKITENGLDFINSTLPHGLPNPSISGAIGFGGVQIYNSKDLVLDYIQEQLNNKKEEK